MIVTNKEMYFNGNTVLEPAYKPKKKIEDEKYKKLQKSKKEALDKQKQLRLKEKVATLRAIAFVFIIGILIVFRFSIIYGLQNDLSTTKMEISNMQAENESIRVSLIKCSNLSDIENNAVNKLNMVRPSASDSLKLDLNKVNYFKASPKNSEVHQSLIEMIKNILF